MSEPYAIAAWIPEEARRYACRFTYARVEPQPLGRPEWFPLYLDHEGFCPLGRVMQHLGMLPAEPPYTTHYQRRPALWQVVYALSWRAPNLLACAGLHDATQHFMAAWDNGYITDLAAAFGVKRSRNGRRKAGRVS